MTDRFPSGFRPGSNRVPSGGVPKRPAPRCGKTGAGRVRTNPRLPDVLKGGREA